MGQEQTINRASTRENLSLGFANNKGTDRADWSVPLLIIFWKKSYLNLLQAKFPCSWGDWFECRFVGNSEDRFKDNFLYFNNIRI